MFRNKLRITFLCILSVIFAVSSAFAELAIDIDDEFETTEDAIEGYTYKTKINMEGDFEYLITRNDEERVLTSTTYTVEWKIRERGNNDISWLKVYPVSDTRSVILEGRLPRYIEGNNVYTIIVEPVATATISGREYTLDTNEEDSNGYIEAYETDIEIIQDEEATLNKIYPELVYSDDFTVYLSYDTAKIDPYKVSIDYEVYLNMPFDRDGEDGSVYMTQEDIENEDVLIFLPPWLSYDYDIDTIDPYWGYITSLRIFYNTDTEYTPVDEAKATIRIIGALDDNEESTEVLWDVTVGSYNVHKSIRIASEDVSLETKFGQKVSRDIPFEGDSQVSWRVKDTTTDITSADMSIDISVDPHGDDGGIITVTATPSKAGTYTGTITFFDSAGDLDSFTITISAEPVLIISEDKIEITAKYNTESMDTLNFYGGATSIVKCEPLPEVPASFELNITSTDKSIAIHIKPTLSDDYTGTFTFTDNYGNTDDVLVILHALSSDVVQSDDKGNGDFTITGNKTRVEITAGNSDTVDIYSVNAAEEKVSWDRIITPQDSKISVTFSPDVSKNTRATISVDRTAEARVYDIAITGTDSAQRKAELGIRLTVTRPADSGNQGGNGNNGNNGNQGGNGNQSNNGNGNQGGNGEEEPPNGGNVVDYGGEAMDYQPISYEDLAAIENMAQAHNLNFDVENLYGNSSVTEGSVVMLNTEEKEIIENEGQEVVFRLRTITVYESKIYVFPINFEGEDYIGLPIFLRDISGLRNTMYSAAYGGVLDAHFYDSSNNRTYIVPDDGKVTCAVYLEKDNTYYPVITVDHTTGPGNPSGACSAGYSILALAFAIPLFFRRKI